MEISVLSSSRIEVFVWCFRFTFASFTCLKEISRKRVFYCHASFWRPCWVLFVYYISVPLCYYVGMTAEFPFVRHTTCIAVNLRYYMDMIICISIYLYIHLFYTCIYDFDNARSRAYTYHTYITNAVTVVPCFSEKLNARAIERVRR